MDYFSLFDCSSPFCILLIEFHCTFSISRLHYPKDAETLHYRQAVAGCSPDCLSVESTRNYMESQL